MIIIVLEAAPFMPVTVPWNLDHDRNKTPASWSTQNAAIISMATTIKVTSGSSTANCQNIHAYAKMAMNVAIWQYNQATGCLLYFMKSGGHI